MGSDADKAHNTPLDDPPSKPSLLSRLTSPLRSRTRNINDFHIRLQEPHRQYSAGDHVKGYVILYVAKPIRLTHLTVALHGFVRVYKHAGAGAQLSPVNPAVISHDRNKNVRYFGNGLASLFQDEQILCGEGRLKPSRFEFEFDLIFPSKGLPSSIDFERGTISYMVTATLTRPTSIAATSSCETKVALVEKVDIGLLVPPRERKVCMQTLRRRGKKKKKAVPTVASAAKRGSVPTDIQDASSDLDSTRVHENSNGSSVSIGEVAPGGSNLPRSPLRSDLIPGDLQSQISGDSVVSNNSGSNSLRGADASAESIAASRASSDDREITATVELLKGGCLPGDILPVKIRVEHNRRMKSMHGVIVTLYRQGRVDYSPPISLFTTDLPKEEAERLEREDYYPRSRTGLGGLSLSSAGSCSVFRKDLSQAVAPLIIDPTSLTANITTSVRVPEDVFPSIKNVPGGLISFKYHVEVVVDLGGRLAGQSTGSSQQTNRMNALGIPGGNPASAAQAYDLKRLANWSGTVVDTDHLRREKGVISVSFEVVVGTMDSTRSRGKSVVRPALTVQPPTSEGINIEEGDHNYTWHNEYDAENGYSEEYPPEQLDASPQGYFPPGAPPQTSYYDFQDHEPHAPAYIPPPELPNESELSEKERVRQAEQRLLPSRPLQQAFEPDAGPSQPSGPSAAPAHLASNVYTPNSHISLPGVEDDVGEGPSAPAPDDLTPMAPAPHADDKQELERRRLLQEASAPPEVPEDYDGGGPSAPPLSQGQGQEMPTAPVLHDDDHDHDYGAPDPYHEIAGPSSGRPNTRSEQLPRYER